MQKKAVIFKAKGRVACKIISAVFMVIYLLGTIFLFNHAGLILKNVTVFSPDYVTLYRQRLIFICLGLFLAILAVRKITQFFTHCATSISICENGIFGYAAKRDYLGIKEFNLNYSELIDIKLSGKKDQIITVYSKEHSYILNVDFHERVIEELSTRSGISV